jgi:hypothetical protein
MSGRVTKRGTGEREWEGEGEWEWEGQREGQGCVRQEGSEPAGLPKIMEEV